MKSKEKDDKWSFLCIRLPTKIVNEIDRMRYEKRMIGVSRTRWILEAIEKQLKE